MRRKGLPTRIDRNINRNIHRFRKSIQIGIVQRPENFQSSIEIVIPCYNHGAFLRKAFESICNQTYKGRLDLTFVNDASRDNSLEIMEEIKLSSKYLSHLTIRILNNKHNLSQGGSINRAIESSSNKLFIILNADDYLMHDCIETILNVYANHPDIFMLGATCVQFTDDAELDCYTRESKCDVMVRKYYPEDALKFDKPNSINMTQSSCSFFRVAWEIVGGYKPLKERVCSYDDRDFQMRVCSVLPVGVLENYPLAFWRQGSSQKRGGL